MSIEYWLVEDFSYLADALLEDCPNGNFSRVHCDRKNLSENQKSTVNTQEIKLGNLTKTFHKPSEEDLCQTFLLIFQI